LRAFLSDRLSAITSESKWKQIVGKAVSEGAYVSDLELRKIYERVMPQTCWTSNHTNHKKVIELEAEIKDLNKVIEILSKQRTQDHEMISTYFKEIGYVPKIEVKKEHLKEEQKES